MKVKTSHVWADVERVVGNDVRQLLVPAGTLEVSKDEEELWVANSSGRWPAHRTAQSDLSAPLTAVVPLVSPSGSRVQWSGSKRRWEPDEVTKSYAGALGFRDHTEENSLRRPQIGALHSVLGHWASGVGDPGVVVMPTGTGKTETMLALLVAARPQRVLVLVPTIALRDQIAGKFESLGVLHRYQIVAPGAQRPVVGRLEHGISDPAEVRRFAEACNVVVATPYAVAACGEEARADLLGAFSHLMVDEAHHAPASKWISVIDAFADRKVLLFTATPFREDGKPLPGRLIFRFPLREAQKENYFTSIDYKAVFGMEGTDLAIAQQAVARLRSDLAAGFDHILMARGESIKRAKELLALYEQEAPDLGPAVLYDKLSTPARKAVFKGLDDRSCRIIVCVDMLGEGFDLPALKVAALHDVRKSLGPMIQLIGRFTRSRSETSTIGTASAFVARDPAAALSPLRDLLREDADWNLLLHDITERVAQATEDTKAFDASFSDGPDEVSTASLRPTMSAVAYRSVVPAWEPERARGVYGARILDDVVAVGHDGQVAWFVIEHHRHLKWVDQRALQVVDYELIVMYFDKGQQLLFIHGSANGGDYADLANAVLGPGTRGIKGAATFRVLGRVDRLIPTNVGLLDSRNHFNRFSMHVGSDVLKALTTAETEGQSQTHIATSGFDAGQHITISAALSGRFWSMSTAPDLRTWRDWCDRQGTRLLDGTIDLEGIFAGFIIPEDLTARPEFVLIGAEWPWEYYAGTGTGVHLEVDGKSFALTEVGIEVDDYSPTGPFMISFVTGSWRVPYRADFTDTGLRYTPLGRDATASTTRSTLTLQQWVNNPEHKLTLFLEGNRMITPQDRLLKPRNDPPFPIEKLTPLDWTGIDLRAESQGPERRPDSIQAHVAAHLMDTADYDVLLDDDGSYEAADLVGLKVIDSTLHITLVHCKFTQAKPGVRVEDLYEVCGQAVRGAKWSRNGAYPLLRHLDKRAQRYHARTQVSPYLVGDINALFNIMTIAPQLRVQFRTIIAQPGLQAAAASDDQLMLLAGTDVYVRTATGGDFEVLCNT
ncbi:DEAD/DEAH box helicase family protein [Actinokineospora auranticolor]|uniref:Superfamily II DNA or RNA helicase n=1 Tax=Actinokineospora auranticolor TaxID=155976 RepID=A0A2S6GDN5_9PSEU|nr:DEAD/DEAH box helicase family protein [Actinokineospora auranticolor]PPK63335.1 superfamily II DNA or RNA helicase [Actinokineospora auranticolor]